ncbi:hypothetical protein [Kineothrix sp. MB12-C1]|uniref:hypothetical protein n=1 Tax=Kineothrix sp. MB12-C1 TaxID=3070215 RepID=UPI0027D2B23A|nr:hypothetical protein [Kineothrix sp. MB12-C1]WMC93155.1 hypothetical protein RBB56_02380 [Kineothrix sp. MB12-C1]
MNSNQITAIIQEILEKSGGKGVQTKGLMAVVGSFKDAVSELKKIDTLVTEISKANRSLSKSDLAKIADTSYDAASKYGKLAADYLADVQAMEKAGYKSAQSMTKLTKEMATVSSQAASSKMDIDEFTSSLTDMIAATQKSGTEMARVFKDILTNIQQVTIAINSSAPLKSPIQFPSNLSMGNTKKDNNIETIGKDLLDSIGKNIIENLSSNHLDYRKHDTAQILQGSDKPYCYG